MRRAAAAASAAAAGPWPRVIARRAASSRAPEAAVASSADPAGGRLSDYRDTGLAVGDAMHGFTVRRVTRVDEFQLTAIELDHASTGAQWLHVAREDPNNVFSAAFRTTPTDSTGAPHILEHTVLCGSERYPVRDPFFKMLNRSLATFMNAMTASDWTAYPFSTTNRQDFYNLLGVYLDAAFFPNIRRLDFLQEGWRIEHADPRDATTPLQFKGVVYNEMKGVFSSPDNVFYSEAQQRLYPGTTYEHVSGGAPSAITDLTWEQLCEFHARYYHPSNCRFYTYGDLPLEPHLRAVNDTTLARFTAQASNFTAVPDVPRWSEPRSHRGACPEEAVSAQPDRQSRVSVSYLLTPVVDLYDQLVLKIILSVLTDSPSAPFFKALLESKLGTDYSPNTGFNTSARETSFAVGVQGAREEDHDVIVDAIQATFERVAAEGLDRAEIDATLHQIELSRKHQTSSFGLSVGIGVLSSWIHGGDPVAQLQLDPLIERFKCDLEDPSFVGGVIRRHFLDNPHRLTLTMVPDPAYSEALDADERARLDAKVAALTKGDRAEIAVTGIRLLEEQDAATREDDDTLPTLRVGDIDRVGTYDEVRDRVATRVLPFASSSSLSSSSSSSSSSSLLLLLSSSASSSSASSSSSSSVSSSSASSSSAVSSLDVPVRVSEQPTNGIVYFKGVVDAASLPDHLQEYLPVFCSVLTQLGAGGRDFRELAQAVKQHTGGLGAKVLLTPDPADGLAFRQEVVVSSHCLERNIGRMFDLWRDVFCEPRFDEVDHLRTLVAMAAADAASSIADSGHSYAQMAAASSLSPLSALANRHSGLRQVAFLQRLAGADADNAQIDDLVGKLREIAAWVLETDRLRCLLVADEATLAAAQPRLDEFLQRLPPPSGAVLGRGVAGGGVAGSDGSDGSAFVAESRSTFFKTPFTVNYAARSVPTVPFSHPDSAALSVLGKAMTAKFLHREIREKGGAYGGGASARSNLFNFYSYRDPNSVATLSAFDAAAAWAASGGVTTSDVNEAKLGLFQGIDTPVSPANRGSRHFLSGVTDAMQQKRREELLDVTVDDVARVAAEYLVDPTRSATAVIGPAAEGDKVSEADGWRVTAVEM